LLLTPVIAIPHTSIKNLSVLLIDCAITKSLNIYATGSVVLNTGVGTGGTGEIRVDDPSM
jgi:hypothetical protein